MNTCIFMGNICTDLQLKYTNNNVEYLNFSIAVNGPYKDQNGNYAVNFIPCVAFKQKAVFISKYFSKGQKILVSGELQSRQYQTQSGEKRTAFEVLINNAEFASNAQKTQNNANNAAPAPTAPVAPAAPTAPIMPTDADFTAVADDVLPFEI